MTEMPKSMQRLPRTTAGLPIPFFVGRVDGKPDFRVMEPKTLVRATRESLCWICGQPMRQLFTASGLRLQTSATFVIGPMCAVNRISGEPPSHHDCAVYAATTCPFLSNPDKERRAAHMPEHGEMAGIGILRNPGVALCWRSSTYHVFRVPNGVLFDVGEPLEVSWYARGRPATRAEVLASIESGLPELQKIAEAEGAAAQLDLMGKYTAALTLVPS